MTDQHDSEEQLFDLESQATATLADPSTDNPKLKRRSFGPKLPKKTLSSSRHSPASSSDSSKSGKIKMASTIGAGSVIGVRGATINSGSPTFDKTLDNGDVVQVNMLESVFSRGEVRAEHVEKMLNYLHTINKLDFSGFLEGVLYQGFDREYYICAALQKVSLSVFCRFAILGAVRGSNFQKIVDSCEEMPEDLKRLVADGKVVKKAKKRSDMTILRFTASIPHWVAFWLLKHDISKKIPTCECPGWLQFPGAASLPMSREVRLQHLDFCQKFSALLPGGTFNGNIYMSAYNSRIPEHLVPSEVKFLLGLNSGQQISTNELQDAISKQVV